MAAWTFHRPGPSHRPDDASSHPGGCRGRPRAHRGLGDARHRQGRYRPRGHRRRLTAANLPARRAVRRRRVRRRARRLRRGVCREVRGRARPTRASGQGHRHGPGSLDAGGGPTTGRHAHGNAGPAGQRRGPAPDTPRLPHAVDVMDPRDARRQVDRGAAGPRGVCDPGPARRPGAPGIPGRRGRLQRVAGPHADKLRGLGCGRRAAAGVRAVAAAADGGPGRGSHRSGVEVYSSAGRLGYTSTQNSAGAGRGG